MFEGCRCPSLAGIAQKRLEEYSLDQSHVLTNAEGQFKETSFVPGVVSCNVWHELGFAWTHVWFGILYDLESYRITTAERDNG